MLVRFKSPLLISQLHYISLRGSIFFYNVLLQAISTI